MSFSLLAPVHRFRCVTTSTVRAYSHEPVLRIFRMHAKGLGVALRHAGWGCCAQPCAYTTVVYAVEEQVRVRDCVVATTHALLSWLLNGTSG